MAYNNITVQSSSPTLIIAANNARKGLLIVNNGTVFLYFGPDTSISTTNSPYLLPKASWNNSGRFDNWRGAVYGLAASSTADVRYWEWTD